MDKVIEIIDIDTQPAASRRKKARITCYKCGAIRELYIDIGAGRGTQQAKDEAKQFFLAHGWNQQGPKLLPVCPDCRNKSMRRVR
jgi:hypothetical protein